MAYFLGRDVNLAITTEHAVCGISVNEDGNVYVDNVDIGAVTNIDNGNDLFTTSIHGLTTGDPVMFTMDAGETISTGIAAGTRYYAIVTSTTEFKVAETKVLATAGTPIDISSNTYATETNVTRELAHSDSTGGNSTPYTFIFNREWPRYDGTGRIDTIIDDIAGDARGIITTGGHADRNTLVDVTGLDVTFGKTDEDIAYFGQRTAGKIEIKNDVTLSITKKKIDHRWTALWNKARHGVLSYTDANKVALDVDSDVSADLPAATTVEIYNANSAMPQPSNGNYGYRIYLITKSGSEVLTLRNMCMSGYSSSLNADGLTEETIEFYGYVDPIVDGDATYGYTTLTPVTDL